MSGRQVVSSYLTDPLLIDMLFCPLMIYGNAAERDMEFGQFVVMFKSIFCEGLARPREGVRRIINVLRRKVREVGGTVRMRCGVKALHVKDGHVRSVELDNGGGRHRDNLLSPPGCLDV